MSHNRITVGLLTLSLVCLPLQGLALSVESAVEKALARDAGLLALEQEVRAQEHLAVADGALPDPEVTIAAEGLPIDDPLAADMMTMYRIGIRQRFPAGNTRSLAGDRRRSDARALQARRQARALDVKLETRLAWLDWAYGHAAAERVDDMRDQFNQLLEITQRRYAAGTGRLQDESQALLEMTLLERRQLDTLTAIDDARARLERWTGPLGTLAERPDLPDWSLDAGAAKTGQKQLEAHPELVAARVSTETQEIAAELARQAYRPSWMFEAGYGHQRGNDPSGRRISDKLFAMATFSLPLFTDDRQDRRVDAALAERDARVAGTRLLLQRLSGELERQHALLNRLQDRRDLLEQRILPQAQATVEATLASYRTDRASFDELIRARLRYLEIELDLIETRRRLLASLARIVSLTNEELS